MNPLEKYIKFNKLPIRFITCIVIIFITTYLVVTSGPFYISNRYLFDAWMKIAGFESDEIDQNSQVFLTIDDFQDHLKQLLENLDTARLNSLLYHNAMVKQAK